MVCVVWCGQRESLDFPFGGREASLGLPLALVENGDKQR